MTRKEIEKFLKPHGLSFIFLGDVEKSYIIKVKVPVGEERGWKNKLFKDNRIHDVDLNHLCYI